MSAPNRPPPPPNTPSTKGDTIDVHARDLVTVKLRVRGFKGLCLRLRIATCLMRRAAFIAGEPLGMIQVGPKE